MPRVYTRRPLAERFWEKVDKDGPGGCWLWTAHRHPKGHGVFVLEKGKHIYAHRWSWMQVNGEIPEGLVIHHKCFNPPCVNPDHLEAVTHGENLRAGPRGPAYELSRRTHCPQGHAYTAENTIRRGGWGRACRECDRQRASRYYYEVRSKDLPPERRRRRRS